MATPAQPETALGRAAELLDPAERDAGTVRSGYLDLLGRTPPRSPNPVQDIMLTGALPKIYERWWRPTWGRIAKGVRGPSMEDEYRIAARLLELHPGDAVLDVACGTGNFTRRFARAVGSAGLVVGIDLSETMLARAATDTDAAGLDPQAAYIRGDAEHLPLADHTFDAVCCFAALNLMADPTLAIDDMTRVLTPGGRIALFTSARFRTPGLRAWQIAGGMQSGMTMFEQDALTGALERNGFVDIRQLLSGSTQFVGGVLGG